MQHVINGPVQKDRQGNIVKKKLKIRSREEVGDILTAAALQVVEADYLMAFGQKSFT
jgi:hypothetical protein